MQQDTSAKIRAFLAGSPFAVVGVSTNREKYGNKVLRCYRQRDLEVMAVHPTETEIEGVTCHRSLSALPVKPHGVSVITPPPVTERIVEEAGQLGLRHLWMQPGAESARAVARAEELGMSVLWGGPCVLVVLGYREV